MRLFHPVNMSGYNHSITRFSYFRIKRYLSSALLKEQEVEAQFQVGHEFDVIAQAYGRTPYRLILEAETRNTNGSDLARTSTVAKLGIPREKWLPTALWRKVTQKIPVPCVDIIFERPDGSILYGWRLITPYRQVWALLGGRILWRESLRQCAFRIAKEYGLGLGRLYLNGVFPVSFPNRSDVVISLAARRISGQPRVDGVEFSKFTWSRKPPSRLGHNYLRMVTNWNRVRRATDYLKLNRLQ